MALKHSNPTQPRRDRDGKRLWARAPYNFVPLPETIVLARDPLDQDIYHDSSPGLTGWIECELETCSPTYVRGMFTVAEYEVQGNKGPEELTAEEKERRAPFFSIGGGEIEGRLLPVIPGGSLRGMIRSLVEIAGYGKMRWVAKEPTFTFRAVAAASDDPLRNPYQDALGRYGSRVEAGYLEKRGDDWYIIPAFKPEDKGWPERNTYLKVKERHIPPKAIPGFKRLNSQDYRPQWHKVSFEVDIRPGTRGRYVAITDIAGEQSRLSYKGVLVCSGNMLETTPEGRESPRKNHALILEPNTRARKLKISQQAVQDYLAGMTRYQAEALADWGGVRGGCLKDGAPVFYVAEGGEVIYFGHSPNFRIPARLFGESRAATPLDFVPPALRNDSQDEVNSRPDLAEAIFGWVEEPVTSPKGQCAGRVFFGDARYVSAADGVWYQPEPITPHTLSGPKPTTFQHYLVQDRRAGHNPDDKRSLAHYGTSPDETQIRGHKLYWHQGDNPDIEATAKERQHEKQLTRIVPLKPGVHFSSRIYFENLRSEELGALWWALTLPGAKGKTYRHKLGMGKPLGMGAVAITPKLVLTDRPTRYAGLFNGDTWNEAATEAEASLYQGAFEHYVLQEQGIAPDKKRLADVERIQMLLAMLEWREGDPAWLEATRYMEIERGPGELNEYKERPVLPDPLVVASMEVHPVQPIRPPAARRTPPPKARDRRPREARPAIVETSDTRMGQVKWFNERKGYGVITVEDGTEVFVHYTNIVGSGHRSLRQGQRVQFRISPGMKGPEAKEVSPLD